MHRFYEIVPSRTQSRITLVAHFIAAGTIYFFVDSGLLKTAAMAGVALAAWCGYRCLIRQDIIRLRVDPVQQLVEFQQSGQPYFYRKYKVYQSRWFAILKLVDQQTERVLILNSDCFNSVENYRRLRFDLRLLERFDAT